MKIKFEVELDVPTDSMSVDEIEELIFDNFINYATQNHLQDVIKLESFSNDTNGWSAIINHHLLWSNVCGAAKWRIIK